jgi:serine/threonine protein kinase
MGSEAPRCPRCGNAFSSEQIEGDFAGICPRCLAGLMNTEPGAEEGLAVTDNAKVRIDTIRAPLKPGAVFKGFEILEILGQGGMGVVYKARQQSLDRIVALKLLNAQLASSEEFSKRFDREAKVLASVNHANVVHVHDFGREDGLLYLVMEHVDGPTLDDVLRKKPVDPAKFLRCVRDVAEGLQRVHEAGLVHRDIKPSNILLSKDGTAKISDFGLAIESEDAQKLTQSGMFVGTPHYVSPEHAQGKKVDGRSDLYSLGVILFEGFAGRPPFQAPSATAILLKHVNEAPPALYKLAPQSPKIVQELVRKLLAKNPAARHDKAGSLVKDLDRALEELKSGPRPVLGPARKAPEPEPASKLPVKWIAGGIAAVAVIAVLIGLMSKPEPKKSIKDDPVAVRVEKPGAPAVKMPEEEKPKEPEPAPAPVPPPTSIPESPKPQEPKAPGIVEEALKAGNKLFDEARALYEEGKAASSVEKLSDAAFKAEEARAKYAAVQEIGSDELKAKGVEQLKLTQQFLKLVHESRLAILNAKGVPAPAAPVPAPAAVVPGAAPVAVPVPAAPVPVRKVAVPEAAELKDAEKVVREVYKADYAKKSPADQQLLAQKLLDQGRGTTDDSRARYVLLREARDIAVTVGDLDLALTAIDELARSYELDIVALKNAALTKIPVRSPEATAGLVEALMDLSRDAMDAENFEVAVSAAARADSLPKPSSDLVLSTRTADLRKEVAATKDEYLRVKSSIDKPGTGDQEALGKYYGFARGDWDRGLPILAVSAKAPLNALAEKDLSRPEEALAQVEIGDGWWDLAEKERAAYRKQHLQERAKTWYESAYSAASGLARTKIEKRLEALDSQVKGPVDLLKLIDPRVDTVNGSWRLEKGSLVSQREWYGRLQIRYVPPEEYDLRIVVERKDHDEDLIVGLPKGDTQLTANLDAGHSTYSAFGIQAVKADASPQYSGKLFTENRTAILLCSVRRKSVGITVDGKKVLTYAWKGDEARGLIATQWEVPNRKVPFIGAHGTVFAVHSMLLIPVTGAGHVDRTAGVGVVPAARPAAASPASQGVPLPRKTVDLLALVDPSKDAVEGEWTLENQVLNAPSGQHVRLQLPVLAPDEYDLKVVLTRLEGVDGIAFGLVQGSSQWTVYVDKFPQEGFQSGMEMLDNGMVTSVRGAQIINGQSTTFEFKVRKGGYTVLKDGKPFLQWQGAYSRLSNFPRWEVRNSRALFLGQWSNRTKFTEVRLTPIAGEGRLLRGGSASAPAAVPGPAPKGSIDLLALIDPKQDSVSGEFTRDASGLLTPNGVPWARTMVPYTPPAEYDLTMVVERKENTNSLNLALPWNKRQVAVVIEGKGPGVDDVTALDFIDGKEFFRNETTTKGPFLQQGKPSTVVISVRKMSFSLLIDGRQIFVWKGDSSRIAEHAALKVPVKDVPVIGCYDSSFLISQLTLMPVSGTGVPLRKASPAAGSLPANAVDLLKLIDPRRDARSGTWKSANGILIGDGHSVPSHMRLDIPYTPPVEYDIIVVVEKEDAAISGDFFVCLIGGGKPFAFSLDGFGGSISGIFDIDGKTPREGPSSAEGGFFKGGVSHTVTYSVRKDSLTVKADGKEFYTWKEGWGRISLNPAMGSGNKLGIGTLSCVYKIKKLVLIPSPK